MAKKDAAPRDNDRTQGEPKKRAYEAPQVKSVKLTKEAAEALT